MSTKPAVPPTAQFPTAALKETDSLTISEFADLFGFPASAVIAAVARQRRSYNKAFYSIPELAKRWECSRAKVYEVLRESEFKILDLRTAGTDKGSRRVPVAVLQALEKGRMAALEEAA
jgi:hypothetical protein